jgi:hypothetical protein
MRMPVWRGFIAAAALFPLVSVGPAAADMADVMTATYGDFSLSPPTPSSVFICHGFGCKYRTEVAFTNMDRARLAQLLAGGHASAEAERRAVASAGAWFDRRIALAAGTKRHVARADYTHMYDVSQFDCIDSSRNTTSLLLVLEELKLLRHHTVDVPDSRGHIFDGRPPHATAVLIENTGGKRWSVDSWTRGYGQPPEIMPLSRWLTLD